MEANKLDPPGSMQTLSSWFSAATPEPPAEESLTEEASESLTYLIRSAAFIFSDSANVISFHLRNYAHLISPILLDRPSGCHSFIPGFRLVR